MLSISLREDKSQPYIFGYIAEQDKEFLAEGIFKIAEGCVSLVSYNAKAAEDFEIFDAVVRIGLDHALSRGIESAFVPQEFGYTKSLEFSIRDFFEDNRNCSK